MSSDGGILVLREIEQRLRVADRLAACIEDPRSPDQITHSLADIIRFRLLMIAAGYEDGNDASSLRIDPMFKMALDLSPSDRELCSQSTISRLENLPDARALLRMVRAMVDLYCEFFKQVPKRITLDIDDTFDAVHGGQQLRLFNAVKNEADALPISPAAKRLAVIGPLANASAEMRGVWWGAAAPEGQVTVLEGLRNALPRAEIVHSAGVEIESADFSGIPGGVDSCAAVDAVILCLGEAAVMSGEASSRAHLGLPGMQRRLAEAVFERAQRSATPVIVILFSGRPLVVPWLLERANAVLAAWFLGSEAGNALADVLTGQASPSGRTPVTWPRASGQVPIFFSERPSGRPFDAQDKFTSKYLDVANEPLFPFGFGLTYGRFELSNLRLSASAIGIDDAVTIQVDVINRGTREAQEAVFLFTHDKVASVSRPKLELKGFGKISLLPGNMGTVTLSLRASELCFLDMTLEPVFEAGEVEILVGPYADRTQLLVASIQLLASGSCDSSSEVT